MVWGCMSAAGVGNLHFIDGILNKDVYVDILKQNVKQSATKLGISNNFAFYQDNDPKHTAMVSRLWLINNCPKLLQPPPQSPDLNVIEHLWDYLAKKLYRKEINSVTELRTALQEEWLNVDPGFCQTLVDSMPRRLEAAIRSKGWATKY